MTGMDFEEAMGLLEGFFTVEGGEVPIFDTRYID